jgi:hypothetical protein
MPIGQTTTHLREANPEGPVSSAQVAPGCAAVQGGELLAEGEVLKGEIGVGPERWTQRAKEADEDGEHRVDHARNRQGPAMSPSSNYLRSSPTTNRFSG